MSRNSKYAFPPGITSMTGPEFAEHKRRVDAQLVAEKAARAARSAEVRKPGPAAALAGLAVGASVTLAGYSRTSQLSSAIRSVYVRTGRKFTSALARDMLTGDTVIGVRVTRVS